MATTNEERRRILCAQHGHLRQTVAAAQQAARELLARRGSAANLQAAVASLEDELRVHLADEERLLEPILATIDAWGPVRLELLRAEHAHQRAVLAVLTGPTASPAAPLVAERMLSLCADVLDDMESEERELLNEKVFRDDLVLLDASDC
jgi:iron-sulfur cluster repair protein YtfE (RIC family)